MGDFEMTRFRSLLTRLAVLVALAVPMTACMTPHGDTVEEKQGSVMAMRDIVLEKAIAENPAIEKSIADAAGYAVFDTVVAKILIVGFANGYGLLVDNATGEDTILDNFAVAVGPGIEISHTYGLAILPTKEAVQAVASGEWNFGGAAMLGFKFGDFGGAIGGTDLGGEIDSYRLFDTGVAIHASLVWVDLDIDEDLN